MKQKKAIMNYLDTHLSRKRLQHTMGVVKAATTYARRFGVDVKKAEKAALLHDCAKWMTDDDILRLTRAYGFATDDVYEQQPQLLHGVAGAYIARETFGIDDAEILDAIIYHTIPRAVMTPLDMIISVADITEENRDFPTVHIIREAAEHDLERAFMEALKKVIGYVVECGDMLHVESVHVYNRLLKDMKKNGKIH